MSGLLQLTPGSLHVLPPILREFCRGHRLHDHSHPARGKVRLFIQNKRSVGLQGPLDFHLRLAHGIPPSCPAVFPSLPHPFPNTSRKPRRCSTSTSRSRAVCSLSRRTKHSRSMSPSARWWPISGVTPSPSSWLRLNC